MLKVNQYLLLLLCCVYLAGCETVEGLGQDFENTGENIKDVGKIIADAGPNEGEVIGTMMPEQPKP